MKIKIGRITLLILLPFLFSCEKDEGGEGNATPSLDKEIRINFPFDYIGAADTTYVLSPTYSYLKDFNKNSYVHIDSIFFICTITTENADTAFVRLYNISDDTIIGMSDIVQSTKPVNDYDYRWSYSKNIVDYLPDHPSDLGIQMRSKNGQSNIYIRSAYLLLKRK